jgi:PKD repeat protein
VTPTTGATISNVRIDFGDGRSQSLGSISAAQSVVHVYSSAGQYTATATVTDAAGGSGSLSTTVIIGSLPVTLSASPPAPTVNSPVTFAVGGIASAQVAQYNWTFDDGTGSLTTTSPQLTHTFTSRGLKNVRVDVIGVSGGTIGSASVTLDVQ